MEKSSLVDAQICDRVIEMRGVVVARGYGPQLTKVKESLNSGSSNSTGPTQTSSDVATLSRELDE